MMDDAIKYKYLSIPFKCQTRQTKMPNFAVEPCVEPENVGKVEVVEVWRCGDSVDSSGHQKVLLNVDFQ